MRKYIAALLCCFTFVLVFAFGGCERGYTAKGHFYFIDEAYENGLITSEDLRDIAYYYHARYGLCYDEGYEPNPKTPATLSKKTEKKIKVTYLLDVVEFPDGDIDHVSIYYYYGTFNGAVGVSVLSDYVNFDIMTIPKYEIGGATFYNFWMGKIEFWVENNA